MSTPSEAQGAGLFDEAQDHVLTARTQQTAEITRKIDELNQIVNKIHKDERLSANDQKTFKLLISQLMEASETTKLSDQILLDIRIARLEFRDALRDQNALTAQIGYGVQVMSEAIKTAATTSAAGVRDAALHCAAKISELIGALITSVNNLFTDLKAKVHKINDEKIKPAIAHINQAIKAAPGQAAKAIENAHKEIVGGYHHIVDDCKKAREQIQTKLDSFGQAVIKATGDAKVSVSHGVEHALAGAAGGLAKAAGKVEKVAQRAHRGLEEKAAKHKQDHELTDARIPPSKPTSPTIPRKG